ncbi:MAG TPA: hypothetical protein VNW95_03055 [Mucilaginibacter sp.]|nr:hypothetical protein [Mucilaginibacter sp.]
MKRFSFFLAIIILASGLFGSPVAAMKMDCAKHTVVKHQVAKPACCNKSKPQHTNGSFCYYCVLCIACIIPTKPGIGRNFVSVSVSYPDLVQSKLSDYNPSCWRPPNA